jgi:Cyclic nucleotide-binding domain
LKHAHQEASRLRDFFSGATLGGEVSRYRQKQNIYTQGAPAETLFYVQKGGVRLSTRRNKRPSAVTAILGVGDFFGELCLVDYPLRMCTAVALTASSIRIIKKSKMLQMIRGKNKIRPHVPCWPICFPTSRTIGITWQTSRPPLRNSGWPTCFCGLRTWVRTAGRALRFPT